MLSNAMILWALFHCYIFLFSSRLMLCKSASSVSCWRGLWIGWISCHCHGAVPDSDHDRFSRGLSSMSGRFLPIRSARKINSLPHFTSNQQVSWSYDEKIDVFRQLLQIVLELQVISHLCVCADYPSAIYHADRRFLFLHNRNMVVANLCIATSSLKTCCLV